MSFPASGKIPGTPGSAQKHFSTAPQVNVQRSTFDRSHTHKTTFNAGYLIPCYVDEMLPGDTFHLDMTAFARLNTLKFPIMDNLYLDFQFWFVPNRILWSNWEKFCGAQTNPGDSIAYIMPVVDQPVGGYAEGSIYDYMGIPTKTTNVQVSALPLRAYNRIYNDWYRDQNIIPSVAQDTGDGPDVNADYNLLRRAKRHDYFTSCLPSPQKGNAVALPLGTFAPVKSDTAIGGTGVPRFAQQAAGGTTYNMTFTNGTPTNQWSANATANAQAFWNVTAGGVHNTGLVTDLSQATAATINQLRLAFQTQKLLERDMRGGTRYTEVVRSHFGVLMPDLTWRPTYLGGSSNPVQVTPVAQTTQPAAPNNLQGGAVLNAFATAAPHRTGFTFSSVEHGILLGIVSLRADLTYQQGLRKLWLRTFRYDYYWPVFAHLGEQAVNLIEIYAYTPTANTTVFGYQERWAEYRYFPSLITGQFRSNHTATYDTWHLAQNFAIAPTLNQTFIEENPPFDRVVQSSTNAPHVLLDMFFKIKCVRPMPVYSVPGFIDHF